MALIEDTCPAFSAHTSEPYVMISLNHLSKRYDANFVVDDVDLSVSEGEIVGLLGPNGAGKTTTLRMIAGVLPPSRGSVSINGKDVLQHPEMKRTIGYLPENNPLYEELTVEEYLRFWASVKGIPQDHIPEATAFVVDHVNIADVYYRPIAELSKGYRQRVGLSQALLTRPEILILDEPTEGLDPNQRREMKELIQSLGKKRTVIISSHVLSEVAKLANRVIIINKGKVVADDSPDHLTRSSAGSQIVDVEIKGKDVLSKLKALPHVKHVEETGKNYFQLDVAKGRDIREDIFKLAVSKKWTILTMLRKELELEDVFSELTKE